MNKWKLITRHKINDFKYNNRYDTELGIFGIFDTHKVMWRYFVISFVQAAPNASITLTPDVCSMSMVLECNIDNVLRYGKEVKTKEDGENFIQEFKIKWETCSNNTTEEIRDDKINKILN